MTRAPWLAALVGAASLAITLGLWRHERALEEASLRASFDAGVRQTATRVEQRMAGYEQMLRGMQGLFMASDPVTRDDFRAYVDALLGGTDFAGLRSIAFAARVRKPDGSDAAPILYNAPETAQNRGLPGYDPLEDPVRRAALEQARDSGRTAITRRIRLQTEGGTETVGGFLMVVPIYARGQPIDNIAARRANLVGWVWTAFRVKDLMAALYGEGMPGLDVSVYDGVDLADDALMFEAQPAPAAARFDAQEYVGFAGHTWTLRIRSLPEFEQRRLAAASQIILAAGGGLSLLLALLTYQLATGRARAYAKAQAMTRELRASEERYRRIVETANEGIWVVDADNRISFVNPQMLQLLGHAEADMLGRPLADFVEGSQPPLARIDAGHAAREFAWRRRDGSALWALLSVSPLVDADGRPAGALGMLTDITEQRRADARRTLLEARLRESQKMEAIGTLAGGIAHDFNNIVAAILGNVALARQQVDTASPAQALLAQIDHAGVRARSLVQQILAFSRMQPQMLVSQPLAPLVQEAVALLRSSLPAGVELETRIAEATLHAGVDATQIQQVVLNLGTNAWHALRDGSGRITVGLEPASLDADAARGLGGVSPGEYAHLWVRDDGAGMDDATRARVFEPFFTTKRIGQGTGLGLSVVHGIVRAHQGAIAVDSAPGRGSTFHLYFPRREPQPEAAAAEPAAVAPPRAQGQHVLYVDDDPAMLLMVEALLLQTGYRVTSADGPSDALAAVQAAPDAYDVIVSDYNMPECSGLDLAAELARVRPDLPVVITSGYITDEMRTAATRLGVRALLQKEYTLEKLAAVLHATLQ
ncbi:MAG: CHASE domain-containing protein [Proteobacteria bacterium]|nr:CHASE domain-containing protein [Pseudomonadota bacterium]